MIPMIGALISGTNSPQTTTAAPTTGHATFWVTIQSGSVAAMIPKLASRRGAKAVEQLDDEHRTDDRADPERREDPAGDVRIAVVARVREQGTATVMPFAAPSSTMIVSVSGPSSLSRAR